MENTSSNLSVLFLASAPKDNSSVGKLRAPLINKSGLSRTNRAVKHGEATQSQLWLKATSLSPAAICCLHFDPFLASISTKRFQTTSIT